MLPIANKKALMLVTAVVVHTAGGILHTKRTFSNREGPDSAYLILCRCAESSEQNAADSRADIIRGEVRLITCMSCFSCFRYVFYNFRQNHVLQFDSILS